MMLKYAFIWVGLIGWIPLGHAALSPVATEGRSLVEAAQCNRCHNITDVSGKNAGLSPADRQVHCVDCHRWILDTKGNPEAIARQREMFPDWERYLNTIVHLTQLPDLGTLTRRVDPAFVRRYLDGPFDLRPHLQESMIPVRLSKYQKDAVVTYLSELNGQDAVLYGQAEKDNQTSISPQRIAEGRKRFVALGCSNCHVVGAHRLAKHLTPSFFLGLGAAAQLAPNLAHVRQRIPKKRLVQFIRDPQSIDSESRMPKLAMEPNDAELLADFIIGTPLGLKSAHSPRVPSIPVLSRRVEYEEIFEDVIGKICIHCHMNPETNNGDGGAGNTGGLGFRGVGLNLETYAGLKKGLRRNGRWVSIIDVGPNGEEPILWKALLRRYVESYRDNRPAYTETHDKGMPVDSLRPGMPMGLPPLSFTQLKMIKTWLHQGAPGPEPIDHTLN